MTTIIRYSTLADFLELDSTPPSQTARAMTLEVDGKIKAIGGVAYVNGRNLAFMEAAPDAPPLSLIKASRRVVEKIYKATRPPLLAERDMEIESSGRYLLHMGFKHLRDNLYIWEGHA